MSLFTKDEMYWTVGDHKALLSYVQKYKPKTVLEFGPGGSTYAYLESGVESIDTCEDNLKYLESARIRFRDYPHVSVYHYTYPHPMAQQIISVRDCDSRYYDMAFIDGPHTVEDRDLTVVYALRHAKVVIVPGEGRPHFRVMVDRLAEILDREIVWAETCPYTCHMAEITCKTS